MINFLGFSLSLSFPLFLFIIPSLFRFSWNKEGERTYLFSWLLLEKKKNLWLENYMCGNDSLFFFFHPFFWVVEEKGRIFVKNYFHVVCCLSFLLVFFFVRCKYVSFFPRMVSLVRWRKMRNLHRKHHQILLKNLLQGLMDWGL